MWITPSTTTLRQVLSATELTALNAAATGGSAIDPAALMARAIQEVRSYVGSCPRNRLGADGTIPDETENDCYAITAFRVIARLPFKENDPIVALRRAGMKDAIAHLTAISKGDIKVVPATVFSDFQVGGVATELVREGCSRGTPVYTNGLL